MKPTAPYRMTASVFATDPARGLSLWACDALAVACIPSTTELVVEKGRTVEEIFWTEFKAGPEHRYCVSVFIARIILVVN
jgi:hypothetical protein